MSYGEGIWWRGASKRKESMKIKGNRDRKLRHQTAGRGGRYINAGYR
jgi:hypothetical protein